MTFKTPDEIAAAAPTWQELAEKDPATATLRTRVEAAIGEAVKHPDGHVTTEAKDGELVGVVYDILKFSVSLARMPEATVRLICAELKALGWHTSWSWANLSCYAHVNKRYLSNDDA